MDKLRENLVGKMVRNDCGIPIGVIKESVTDMDSGKVISLLIDPFDSIDSEKYKLNDKSKNCFDNESPGIKIGGLPFPCDYTIGLSVSGSVEVLDYNDDGGLNPCKYTNN
jgi:sporulation protein YlmC with PRC-barrel domain